MPAQTNVVVDAAAAAAGCDADGVAGDVVVAMNGENVRPAAAAGGVTKSDLRQLQISNDALVAAALPLLPYAAE